jgi:hypothetical protein
MELARGVVPKRHFRSVDLKNSCTTARRHSGRYNGIPWKKAELHQAPCNIFRQINTIENAFFAGSQIGYRSRRVDNSRIPVAPLDTHLQLNFSIRRGSGRVKDMGLKWSEDWGKMEVAASSQRLVPLRFQMLSRAE